MSMQDLPPTDRIDLRDYLQVLRRRALLIAACTILVTSIALGRALVQTPVYRSAAILAIEPSLVSSDGRDSEITDQEIDTQLQVIQSQEVAALAAAELGIGLTPQQLLAKTFVARVPDTRVIQVAAIDVAPERAADIAQTLATSYLVQRRQDALDRVLAATEAVQARTSSVRNRIDAIDRQLEGLAEGSGAATALEAERAALREQLGQLTAQSSLLDATESFVRSGGEIIRSARPASSPIAPQPVRSGLVGALAGLALGIALAFVRDRFDDAVRSDAEVARACGDRPVIAHVPAAETDQDGRLELLADPGSIVSESLRTLRTNVRFAAGRHRLKSILIGSPGEGEGKSTIAANLAVAAAQAGQRVLLIDADMRRPSIHRLFGLVNGIGLSSVLTGEQPSRAVLQHLDVGNLAVMTAGIQPPNPAELLADGLLPLIAEVNPQVDLIIVDGPPLLAVADSLEVSLAVEATVLVAAHGLTSRRALVETARRLDHVGGHLIGVVFNATPLSMDYYGYYGSGDHGLFSGSRKRGQSRREFPDVRDGTDAGRDSDSVGHPSALQE